MALKTRKGKKDGKVEVATRSLLDSYLLRYHERIHRDNLTKLTSHLDHDHPVKILIGEQNQIMNTLSLLEKTREKFQQCGKFECATVEQWQLLARSVNNFKKIDRHFHQEEELLFPELVEYGFSSEVRQIMIEHNKVHELVDSLIATYNNGLRDNYGEMSAAINTIGLNLARRIRLLAHRESHILYPRVLRVISGQNSWQRLREIAQALHVRLT